MKRLLLFACVLSACKIGLGPAEQRAVGQDDFVSAPPHGNTALRATSFNNDAAGAPGTNAPEAADTATSGGTSRAVEETDLYRIDGDRLYYLNGYRGLMVFDISSIDAPRLLGRSAIYGSPVEMIVRNGKASIVIADWFGKMDNGQPFRGSIVRTIDATNPADMRVLGEARLGGFVRDVRVVGDVLYAVSENYGWAYGWGYAEGDAAVSAPGSRNNSITISSVNLNTTTQAGSVTLDGYSGIFNVTANAIMMARTLLGDGNTMPKTELQYVDISDPAGAITLRGKLQLAGSVQGFGTDNGRFNLDFSDGRYARLVTCNQQWCGPSSGSYVIYVADFVNPAQPTLSGSLNVASSGWSIAARFSGDRLYLAPSDGYYGANTGTPIRIYNLKNPLAPAFAGEAEVDGNVWMFMPNGDHLFALGSDYDGVDYGSAVTLHYLNVANPAMPKVIGTSAFGDGWAWTPAAGTFKALTLDNTQQLVVLPFSGWSAQTFNYNNGVQLIEFSGSSVATRGAAKTKGWVSRGVLAKGRILAMSDTALSVVNYDDRAAPNVVKELTLARNVVDAVPNGNTITHLSTDWWDNDLSTSTLRLLPIDNADEAKSLDAEREANIEGTQARLFRNGDLAYVLTNVRKEAPCSQADKGGGVALPTEGGGKCYGWTQRITVVDLGNGSVRLRGSAELPAVESGWHYWGFYGCFPYDWYHGADAVQVGQDAIAVRRWAPTFNQDGYVEAKQALFVVDLRDPDAPAVASTTIAGDPHGWWGAMFVVGDTLYTNSYEWVDTRVYWRGFEQGYVRYYLSSLDLSDRTQPKVGAKINVPGVVVGFSEADPSIAYSIDYRWYDDTVHNWFMTLRLDGQRARLQGFIELSGYTGRVFARGSKAYFSAQTYGSAPTIQLHELDVADPRSPIDRVSSEQKGWGWMLGLAGDRAVLTTGWGGQAVDLYQLNEGHAPVYEQTVRTRGWWSSALSRQDDTLFLSSGYWGVQTIPLQ